MTTASPLLVTSPPQADEAAPEPLASNAVRLSARQWLAAAAVFLLLAWAIPAGWKRIEPLDAGPDYRVPFSLGNDYWMVQRWIDTAASRDKTLLVGDSVFWGHYVDSRQTLSHYLNELAGEERFANLGVDGIHPAALLGLVEHYGGAIRGRNVVLHCNLLWISSPRHDLSGDKEFAFNHPALVPQFFPRIPCYRESLSERLGNVIDRQVPLLGWARHVEVAYFDNTDLPQWTIEHPKRSPTAAITLKLPSPDELPSPKPDARPWTEQGIGRFNPDWVELDESLQWRFFRETVELLRRRNNRVFVLVGPFNEHMLGEQSCQAYQARKRQVEDWLQENGVPHHVPPPLASPLYADASHPLAEGYATLAGELLDDAEFRKFSE
jgi:hypothetical protein